MEREGVLGVDVWNDRGVLGVWKGREGVLCVGGWIERGVLGVGIGKEREVYSV